MNSVIEHLNQWGANVLSFAWPMLWQSSLMMAVLLAIDALFGRKIRASVRYALWLVVLVKLCLPPALALPTGAAWWLFPKKAVTRVVPVQKYVVTYDSTVPLADSGPESFPAIPTAAARLDLYGWVLVGSGLVSFSLLVWLGIRWWQISQRIRRTELSEEISRPLEEVRCCVGLRAPLRLKLADGRMSPAVCGLFRPVILLPRVLAEELAGEQLRAVLLHEAFHVRRKDVWVNCVQALVQIVYWWHPLLWLANARIRRLREEAVDDAVMLALHGEADRYAPTLLAVAKLASNRPLMSLGLVGIMESRSALRKRIERLVNFSAPRKAGLTLISLVGVTAFAAVAVPMGEAPGPAELSNPVDAAATQQQSLTLHVNPETFIRNVKAQASRSPLSLTNDYTAILLDLLRSECVDCNPPNGIKFNTHTGEITTQNTPEKLEVFQRVIEQLNRADGICELPLGNNPLRKDVLIEARLYQMTDADFDSYVSGLQFYRSRQGDDAWWSATPEQFHQLIASLESSGLPLIQRPRIQTGSGVEADFFVGNGTNSVQFDCKPYVENGSIAVSLLSAVARVAPSGSAVTNHFKVSAAALTGGGIVVRVKNYGGAADNNLAVFINMELATNTVRFQERLQKILRPRNGAAAGSQGPAESGQGSATNSHSFVERLPVTIPENTAGDAQRLFSRTFKVDNQVLVANLEKQSGSTTNVATLLRRLFSEAGVDLKPPKSIFYNDRRGLLFIRATSQELDTVEAIAARFITPFVQIHIKARFLEVPKGAMDGFGNPGKMTGTNQSDQFLGILTDENARATLRTLQSQTGVEELAEPEVTTISGLQTEMRATQMLTIITNFTYSKNNSGLAIIPQTNAVETGPVLDAIATVSPDGYTIKLTTVASVTEFLGYDRPSAKPAQHMDDSGNHVPVPVILPSFQIHNASADLKLWDGDTVVLGLNKHFYENGKEINAEPDYFVKTKSTRKQSDETQNDLLVLITVTLIDSAGNRVHSADEISFARNSIPRQGVR